MGRKDERERGTEGSTEAESRRGEGREGMTWGEKRGEGRVREGGKHQER